MSDSQTVLPGRPDDVLEAVAMAMAGPDPCCMLAEESGRCCMTERALEVLAVIESRTGVTLDMLERRALAGVVRADGELIAGHTFEYWLDLALDDMRALLIAKNKAYGNSALDPVRVFASSDAAEQIRVRLDDKISRLVRGHRFADENTAVDLLGYLILLRIAELIGEKGGGA